MTGPTAISSPGVPLAWDGRIRTHGRQWCTPGSSRSRALDGRPIHGSPARVDAIGKLGVRLLDDKEVDVLKRTLRVVKALVAAGAVVAVGALGATPAAAASVCSNPAGTAVFAPWGDNANYFLAPGGSFEGRVSWLRLGGATPMWGNEPWKVAGSRHATSLRLPAGAFARSPDFCGDMQHPQFRFFAKSLSGTGRLDVLVGLTSVEGMWLQTHVGSIHASGTGWIVSPAMDLVVSETLPESYDHSRVDASVAFKAVDGDWAVDDVYVDPYRTR